MPLSSYDYDGSRLLCLEDLACGMNEHMWSVTFKKDTSNSDYRPATHVHMWRSEVSYQCGPGRRFHMSTGSRQLYLNYTCELDDALGEPGFWKSGETGNPVDWASDIPGGHSRNRSKNDYALDRTPT